jgi:putative hydrolase of the HAD superfamily
MMAVVENKLPPRAVQGIVFDGDDTLWSTECLYDAARNSARQVVTEAGFDGAAWEELERRIDVRNVDSMGFSAERFPTSCAQAYEELCRRQSLSPDPAISAKIQQAARSVFELEAPLVLNVRETLRGLRAQGMRLALLTKGDPEIQARRIQNSGLRDFFEVVEIVPEKSASVIRSVVDRLGVEVESALMVGNSVQSDLIPAIEAGLQVVWVNAHVWEYERRGHHLADDRFTSLPSLADIASVIPG